MKNLDWFFACLTGYIAGLIVGMGLHPVLAVALVLSFVGWICTG